jgi:hypothetical protein
MYNYKKKEEDYFKELTRVLAAAHVVEQIELEKLRHRLPITLSCLLLVLTKEEKIGVDDKQLNEAL